MNIIEKIESLLLEEFKTVPFHNYFMLNKIENKDLSKGGTCSDRVLHFKAVLDENNIESNLHSSFINNLECHRMLSLVIDKKKYFIDIGSGWPSLKIFPEFKPIEYSVYGMSFKTEVSKTEIIIYHKTKELFKQMIVIPKETKSESEILLDIKNRYQDTSIYPFHNSLRFSMVKDDSFYFIKGNRLRIFNRNRLTEKILDSDRTIDYIRDEFGIHFK